MSTSKLGHWLNHQRVYKTKGKLKKEREEKLNLVGQWYFTFKEVRQMKSDQEFNDNIRKLEAYKSELIRSVSHQFLCLITYPPIIILNLI